TKQDGLKHIRTISRIHTEQYVWMDRFTIRNLELISPLQESGRSLLDVLDRTVSPMGARMLKKWLALPLVDLSEIRQRHDMVAFALDHPDVREQLQDLIRQVGDLERVISKVSLARINPREFVQLRRSLQLLQPLRDILITSEQSGWVRMADQMNLCEQLLRTLEDALEIEAPAVLAKGHVIRTGYNAVLDEYRDIRLNSKEILV